MLSERQRKRLPVRNGFPIDRTDRSLRSVNRFADQFYYDRPAVGWLPD